MSIIAILGAGSLGGALAHKLAGRNRVRAVRLIDPASDVAAGKALDIQQASPVERFDTRVTAGEIEAVIGAAAVVITGPVDTPEEDWQGEAALALLDRVAGLTRRTPIVCAGASQGPLVAAGVRQLGLDRRRIFGSAPAALVSGLRALVALEAGVSPGEVAINLLGVPPAHPVVTWSSATIRGYPLDQNAVTAPTGASAASCRTDVATRPVCPGVGGRPSRGSAGGGWGAADVHLLCRCGLWRGVRCQVGRRHSGPRRGRGLPGGQAEQSGADSTRQCAWQRSGRPVHHGASSP